VGEGSGGRVPAPGRGLGGNITWTGLIENPFAEGVYAAADVVCQLSRWEEVFGWVIAEAMATGKPLVATRVGGIPELVEHGETGFLVNRGDAGAAASSILTLLRDPDLRERMGCAGRKRAAERFNLTENVGRVVELYGIE
jgi:glycosyltransferase involved in cell wall biosynthesis